MDLIVSVPELLFKAYSMSRIASKKAFRTFRGINLSVRMSCHVLSKATCLVL